MAMEHVIAGVTEQILHTLLALDDGTDRSAQLALETHFGGVSLHDVFRRILHWHGVAVLLRREVNYFVIRVGADFSRKAGGWRADPTRLIRLQK